MILATRSATLTELRSLDCPPSELLALPLVYQIVLAAAFQQGNRALVREMIVPDVALPTPGHHLLFGCDKGRGHDTDPGQERDFGGAKGYGHGAMRGQIDNGCDLWVDIICAGWAAPRAYMQCWAATTTSTSTEHGKRLIKVLQENNVKVDFSAVLFALSYHQFHMLDHLLALYKPTQEEEYNLLIMAAGFGEEDGVRALEILFRHGVKNINWVDTSKVNPPLVREDKVPRRHPLHVAAGTGSPAVVDWLLRHGAELTTDYFFQDPY
ncbi:hypothetical protein LZ31DRAFT_561396 [Colletotrichum somersetense]|nr:hypothetical protein LZ31DRAFT_561396 [Colletotrichum somersetense]